jgi:hypothetical protein
MDIYRVSTRVSVVALIALVASAMTRPPSGPWLDMEKPADWNTAGAAIPAAPKGGSEIDVRCRALARPPQLTEDRQVRDRGWDLVGAFQGGWDVIVILGAASYDGMCRPLQYQGFVFANGAFAGTLSPAPMDSRTDGALGRVTIQNRTRLIAEYSRYAESDPLCCPSRRSLVTFEIAGEPAVVRPASISTDEP